MLLNIRQNRFSTRWKHSAVKFYPMFLTHQTWCWRHFLFLACTNIWMRIQNVTPFCIRIRVRTRTEPIAVLHSKRKHVRSNSLYSKHLTRSQSLVPAKDIAYTNITHIVIPLSLCLRTLFSKSEDHLFLPPVRPRSTRTIVTQRTRYLAAR